MKHPHTRAERRAVRDYYISRRKFISLHVWRTVFEEVPHEGSPWYMQTPTWFQPFDWGRNAKFNLNCGCRQCHANKYFKEKRKRRRALDQAIIDNLLSWAEHSITPCW